MKYSSWCREVTLEPMESTEGGDATFANESRPTVYGVVIDWLIKKKKSIYGRNLSRTSCFAKALRC